MTQQFKGKIGRTIDVSKAWWPEPKRAKKGAPNVLFIILDDTGFGQLGCYGGLCDTPNLDRLAKNGILYNNMHTTALCSPTRSCVLTGRNHHKNGMACITELSTGFPGYNGYIPFENGFVSEVLKENGYNTFAVGKWHLTPSEEGSAAGPFDRWPLGRGFERYYGFLGGDTDQYYPELVYDNHQVEPPKTPEEGYILNEDLADKAIEFIADAQSAAPEKPFFMYFCTGATHAPHHAPKEWIKKYKGKFDMGWDKARQIIFKRQLKRGIIPAGTKLSPRDADVQEWKSLPAKEKKLYARMMEVFAGFLSHTDHVIGRLMDYLEEIDELDNTLIMVLSDNGASAEGGRTGSVNEFKIFNFVPESLEENLKAYNDLGGPKYFNHYAWGWTWAGDTPFRRWKRETYRGGSSDPFIVHWPKGINRKGRVCSEYAHAVDMAPTVFEALGIKPPKEINGVKQSPIQGMSFAKTFKDTKVKSKRKTQYFEMFAHRSIYHNGWRAVCPWPGPCYAENALKFGTPITAKKLKEVDKEGWELYDIKKDPTEINNLAKRYPKKLKQMIELWYKEAEVNDVLPIDGRAQQRFGDIRPQVSGPQKKYTYYPDTQTVPENATFKTQNRSYVIEADVEIPKGGAKGVLICQGSKTGGYTFFVKDNKLQYVYNYVGSKEYALVSNTKIRPGKRKLKFEFRTTGKPEIEKGKGAPGHGRLYIDNKMVGERDFPFIMPLLLSLAGGGVMCGRNRGARISKRYRPPFEFTGKIDRVTITPLGRGIKDKKISEGHGRAAIKRH